MVWDKYWWMFCHFKTKNTKNSVIFNFNTSIYLSFVPYRERESKSSNSKPSFDDNVFHSLSLSLVPSQQFLIWNKNLKCNNWLWLRFDMRTSDSIHFFRPSVHLFHSTLFAFSLSKSVCIFPTQSLSAFYLQFYWTQNCHNIAHRRRRNYIPSQCIS